MSVSLQLFSAVVAGVTASNLVPYRWKGENVSTTEVSEVLGLVDFIKEANVYGVTVPGLWNLSVTL